MIANEFRACFRDEEPSTHLTHVITLVGLKVRDESSSKIVVKSPTFNLMPVIYDIPSNCHGKVIAMTLTKSNIYGSSHNFRPNDANIRRLKQVDDDVSIAARTKFIKRNSMMIN